MSVKAKKYLITTERHEVIKIRRSNLFQFKYCAKCEQQVELMTLDAITSETGKSTRELFQLAENHLLHSLESNSGHLLICRKSLTEIGIIKEKINE